MQTRDAQFENWLQEPTEWRGEVLPRSRILRHFTEYGLIPFLYSKGYELACSERHFANCIATGLFENQGLSHLTSAWKGMPPRNTTEEEDAHTAFVLDSEAWDSFWSSWGDWEDVDPVVSFRGFDRRMDIEAFVWECIEYDRSVQSAIFYEILCGGEEEDAYTQPIVAAAAPTKTTDLYLQESVEYNGWAGYRK
jgi:hypothetical protein